MAHGEINLGYAARQSVRWYQRRCFQRIIWTLFLLAMLPIVAAVGVFVTVRVSWAVRSAWNQRTLNACLDYVAPPGEVVLDMTGDSVPILVPATPRVKWFPPAQIYPTLFLHRVRDRAPGRWLPEQLIAVQLETAAQYTYDGRTIADSSVLSIQPWSVPPKAGALAGRCGNAFGSTSLVILPQKEDHIRFFAGAIDANDPAHFVLELEYNGTRQTVDGTLNNGLIKLAPRAGRVESAVHGWEYVVFWSPAGATEKQLQLTRNASQSAGTPSQSIRRPPRFGHLFDAATKPTH